MVVYPPGHSSPSVLYGGLPLRGLPTPLQTSPEAISGGVTSTEQEPSETGEGELPQPIGGQSEPGEGPIAYRLEESSARRYSSETMSLGSRTFYSPAWSTISKPLALRGCQAYPFALAPQTDHTFHMRLSDLAAGMHDLVFLIFERPDEHTTNPEFREESRDLFDFYRVNLYVGGSASPPSITYTPFSEPDEFAPQGMYLYTISREVLLDPWQTPWHYEILNPGQEVRYYATLNNPERFPTQFALVAFLNFEQVPFTPDHMVFYGQVESQKRASVETSLIPPPSPGPYELLVLMVDNPYIDLTRQDLSSDINSSDRVLLTVR